MNSPTLHAFYLVVLTFLQLVLHYETVAFPEPLYSSVPIRLEYQHAQILTGMKKRNVLYDTLPT